MCEIPPPFATPPSHCHANTCSCYLESAWIIMALCVPPLPIYENLWEKHINLFMRPSALNKQGSEVVVVAFVVCAPNHSNNAQVTSQPTVCPALNSLSPSDYQYHLLEIRKPSLTPGAAVLWTSQPAPNLHGLMIDSFPPDVQAQSLKQFQKSKAAAIGRHPRRDDGNTSQVKD